MNKNICVGTPGQLFVILVGPDCAGKSTIAKHLETALGMPCIKGERIKDRLQMIQKVNERLNNPAPCILDRFQAIDDIIYERYYSTKESPMELLWPEIENKIRMRRGLILYVTANERELEHRYEDRGDPDRSITEILQVAKQYDVFISKCLGYVKTLDTSVFGKEAACERAESIVRAFYGI